LLITLMAFIMSECLASCISPARLTHRPANRAAKVSFYHGSGLANRRDDQTQSSGYSLIDFSRVRSHKGSGIGKNCLGSSGNRCSADGALFVPSGYVITTLALSVYMKLGVPIARLGLSSRRILRLFFVELQ
ncbi:MAG: hypothetical protein O2936_12935, partial [Proteobacteria bacterium]|nr:hypothetical protein [Pseudomonadota bacterium]